MANYNVNLLNTINKVREGNSETFTIGYKFSPELFTGENKITSPHINKVLAEDEMYLALQVWVEILNVLYSTGRKVKGNLQCKLVNNLNTANDLNINVSSHNIYSDVPVEVFGNYISLKSSYDWRILSNSDDTISLFGIMMYSIAKVLCLPVTEDTRTSINPRADIPTVINNNISQSKLINVVAKVLTSTDIKKSLSIVYGGMGYNYPIVYGCLDRYASNYNPKANRSSQDCVYESSTTITSYKPTT